MIWAAGTNLGPSVANVQRVTGSDEPRKLLIHVLCAAHLKALRPFCHAHIRLWHLLWKVSSPYVMAGSYTLVRSMRSNCWNHSLLYNYTAASNNFQANSSTVPAPAMMKHLFMFNQFWATVSSCTCARGIFSRKRGL